jgi:hypothetical protein
MLSAHVLSLETPFASWQIGKWWRYSDSDWLTYDCWHCFLVFNIWASHALKMTINFYNPTLQFHLPNLLLTQNLIYWLCHYIITKKWSNCVYPTLFSSVPPLDLTQTRMRVDASLHESPLMTRSEKLCACMCVRGVHIVSATILLKVSKYENIWGNTVSTTFSFLD